MKFSLLIDQIKTEARLKTDDGFTPVAIGLLNELFKEATEAQRPFELRDEIRLPVIAATGLVTLPTNFFVHHQVQFIDSDTGRNWVLTDSDKAVSPAPRGLYGHPKSFEIQSGQILLYPPDAVVTGDQVNLVYYKIPPIVVETSLTTENPIPRLEPFLIRSAIRRLRMFHGDDLQVAQMLGGDVSSAASAYTKDEPVRNP